MIIDYIEKGSAERLKSKAAILTGLIIVLFILLILFFRPGAAAEKVKIVEKYYPQGEKGTAVGVETKKKIKVSVDNNKSKCAIKFSNGKTLELDCSRSWDFRNHETVYIEYDDNQITDIRRKK